jgi:hypothetical protein
MPAFEHLVCSSRLGRLSIHRAIHSSFSTTSRSFGSQNSNVHDFLPGIKRIILIRHGESLGNIDERSALFVHYLHLSWKCPGHVLDMSVSFPHVLRFLGHGRCPRTWKLECCAVTCLEGMSPPTSHAQKNALIVIRYLSALTQLIPVAGIKHTRNTTTINRWDQRPTTDHASHAPCTMHQQHSNRP